MDEVFGRVNLPGVTMSSHTEVLPPTDDISSVSSLSSHRESAVDVPVSHQVSFFLIFYFLGTFF